MTVNDQPLKPFGFDRNSKIGKGVLAFGVVMFLSFIASAYLVAHYHKRHRALSIAVGAVWIVGVPLFFLLKTLCCSGDSATPTGTSKSEPRPREQTLGDAANASGLTAME